MILILLLLAPIAAAQLDEALKNVTSSPIGLIAKEDAVLDFRSYFGSRRPSAQQTGALKDGVSMPSTRGIADGVVMGPATRYQKPYNICTSAWDPFVVCDPLDPLTEFSGYQVELWRMIAKDLGILDADWFFTCLDWTPMMDDLLDPNGGCFMAAAGVEVSLDNLAAGFQFSWPFYRSGFKILISGTVESGSTWAFASAFHWSVWLALGGLAVIVGVLIAVQEWVTLRHGANRQGMAGWLFYSSAKLMYVHTHVGDPQTLGSRTLVLAYGFLTMILLHLYTATSASRLTQQRLDNDINSRADLPGKKVETWDPYTSLLRKYSIDADGLPWETEADTQTLLDNLRTHKYQALVLDAPVLEYLAGKNEACDLFVIGDAFETFSIAIGFSPDFPKSAIGEVSTSIVRLQTQQGALDMLDNTYVRTGGTDRCFKSAGGHSTGSQITLTQVAGLWYIMALVIGVSFIITAITVCRKPVIERAKSLRWTSSKRDHEDNEGEEEEPHSPSHLNDPSRWKRRSRSVVVPTGHPTGMDDQPMGATGNGNAAGVPRGAAGLTRVESFGSGADEKPAKEGNASRKTVRITADVER